MMYPSLLEEIHQKRQESFGVYHKETLAVQSHKALTLCQQGNTEKALLIFKEITLKQKEIHEPNDLEVLNSENGMVTVLLAMEKYAESCKIEFCIGKVLNLTRMTVTALKIFLALETKIATFCPNSILTEGNKKEIQGIRFDLKRNYFECVFDRIKNEMKNVGNGGGKYFIKNLKCMKDDVNYQYMSGITPLYVAVANDDKNKVCALLGKGVDVLQVLEGSTALHTAAINGCVDIAETIIKYTQQHNRSSLRNLINATTTD
ncbi:hypothetical protein TNIN_187241 [Trichonephila inaurata madagascariensis]|uniref:Uncharacterized protein n=1 Tax=Trichonephila inaurata madagascariensis TaxID=2747483 RepID=A0A8X6YLU7_9ARAC|nr:hypothetical protein TNIN_187241 [Trichonephila inaurata madagascariensis]